MPPKRKATDVFPDDERSNPAVRPSPRKSACQAEKAKSRLTSNLLEHGSAAASKTTLRSGGDKDKGRNSSEKSLSNKELVREVLKMVMNKDRAEIMILSLMEAYSFSYPQLKELLTRKLISSLSLM